MRWREVRVHPTGSDHHVHRHAQPRPGPRDDLRAGRLRPARRADRADRRGAWRHRARSAFGMGTYGSRSLPVGGSALVKALDKVVDKGKKIAAHLMEASEADIEFKDGKFTVAGTDTIEARSARSRSPPMCRTTIPLETLGAGPRRDRLLRSEELHLPVRHAYRRGRDRPRHRRRAARQLHRGRRFRHASSIR